MDIHHTPNEHGTQKTTCAVASGDEEGPSEIFEHLDEGFNVLRLFTGLENLHKCRQKKGSRTPRSLHDPFKSKSNEHCGTPKALAKHSRILRNIQETQGPSRNTRAVQKYSLKPADGLHSPRKLGRHTSKHGCCLSR